MEEAVQAVQKMSADLGGTEILSPLTHIYKQSCIPNQPRQVEERHDDFLLSLNTFHQSYFTFLLSYSGQTWSYVTSPWDSMDTFCVHAFQLLPLAVCLYWWRGGQHQGGSWPGQEKFRLPQVNLNSFTESQKDTKCSDCVCVTLHSRCFSFGIGEGASSALINGLAKEGRGHAQFITGTDRMQPKVSDFSHEPQRKNILAS